MSEQVESHILRAYILIHKLGSGAYGHVWRIRDRKTGKNYALKKIFEAFQHSTDAKRTYRQISILRQLSHPNIIKLYKVIKAENDKDLYLIFQLMECDLHFVIHQKRLQQRHRKYVIYQLLKSLKYLHSAKLIHRDLKPSNLLINSSCGIKICDFGLVRLLRNDQHQQQILTGQVATRWYRAPQVLLGSNQYSYQADIWSTGCILGQMLLGKAMFPGSQNINMLQKIFSFIDIPSQIDLMSIGKTDIFTIISGIKRQDLKKKQSFSKANPDGVDLVYKMLKFNPYKRITISEALNHPYLKEFSGSQSQPICQKIISLQVSQNKKLSVKGYRGLIYDQIQNYYSIRQSNNPSIRSIRTPSFKKKQVNYSLQRQKSIKSNKSQKQIRKSTSLNQKSHSSIKVYNQISHKSILHKKRTSQIKPQKKLKDETKAPSKIRKGKRSYMDLLSQISKIK